MGVINYIYVKLISIIYQSAENHHGQKNIEYPSYLFSKSNKKLHSVFSVFSTKIGRPLKIKHLGIV